MNKPALLMSACLLGHPVRYDATGKPLSQAWDQSLHQRFRIVPICPEMAGGLPAPRPPCEILGGDGHTVQDGDADVLTAAGVSCRAAFVAGAEHSVALAQANDCRVALLKANSPSCGSGIIYSGNFDGRRQSGDGVAAAALRRAGVALYSELSVGELLSIG